MRLYIIAAALILIAVGVWRGEHLAVLGKAAFICMECIGLG